MRLYAEPYPKGLYARLATDKKLDHEVFRSFSDCVKTLPCPRRFNGDSKMWEIETEHAESVAAWLWGQMRAEGCKDITFGGRWSSHRPNLPQQVSLSALETLHRRGHLEEHIERSSPPQPEPDNVEEPEGDWSIVIAAAFRQIARTGKYDPQRVRAAELSVNWLLKGCLGKSS